MGIYIQQYLFTYIYIHVCVYMYIYIYVCVMLCMHIWCYICIHDANLMRIQGWRSYRLSWCSPGAQFLGVFLTIPNNLRNGWRSDWICMSIFFQKPVFYIVLSLWKWLPTGELTFCHGTFTIFHGKIHYKLMAIFHCYLSSPKGNHFQSDKTQVFEKWWFSIAMLVHQRVSLWKWLLLLPMVFYFGFYIDFIWSTLGTRTARGDDEGKMSSKALFGVRRCG